MRESLGPAPPQGVDRITKVAGQCLLGNTTTSFVFSKALNTDIAAKLTSYADGFQLYRFVWLKFTLYPQGSLSNNATCVAFLPFGMEGMTAPADMNAAVECTYSVYVSGGSTNAEWCVVPRSDLMGRNPLKWFQTRQPVDINNVWQDQGQFFVRADATSQVFDVYIQYECEFCNPLPQAVTLQRQLERLGIDEVPEVKRALVAFASSMPPTLVPGVRDSHGEAAPTAEDGSRRLLPAILPAMAERAVGTSRSPARPFTRVPGVTL